MRTMITTRTTTKGGSTIGGAGVARWVLGLTVSMLKGSPDEFVLDVRGAVAHHRSAAAAAGFAAVSADVDRAARRGTRQGKDLRNPESFRADRAGGSLRRADLESSTPARRG